ncbi:MAG: nickel-dependent lactate racemase [Gemmatales bacterium]|nr:nickel-dependent lactate racemase [Gemmatales bacterium]MDW8385484.1 lactate racemase domain-containing protein [Gemmatales bacterium]
MQFPRLVRLRQHFERPRVENVPEAIRKALETLDLASAIRPGQSVALTAGSRGIANIALILRSVANFLRELGAKPFIVPAMGSHGGGTAEGQRKILESYGITEQFTGVPIRASMEVVSLGSTPEGFPVVLDRIASEADHIGVIARIKPHTAYEGPIESGLLKMMMIGLGKHAGAIEYHRILLEEPYDRVVRAVGRHVLSKAPIRFGLAIVENAYDETALIEAVRPEDFEPVEERLLTQARAWLARLPWRKGELLIVDEIGKDISGSGMDTNVVGRKRAFRGQPTSGQPEYRSIFVRGLSAKTHGNAAGIGMADFTTARLVKAMDYRATVINCVTAGYPEGANIPVYFDTDREVIEAALAIIGRRRPEQARVIRIKNTLELETIYASEACLEEPVCETQFTVESKPTPISFDAEGNLLPWPVHDAAEGPR